MSDRFAAQLKIGGKLNEKQVQDLIDALHEDAVWHGADLFEPRKKSDIISALKDGHLTLFNEEALNGAFANIEEALEDAGISYERWSCYPDQELVYWHPGMSSSNSILIGNDYSQICYQNPVEQTLDLLIKWLEHSLECKNPSNDMVMQAIDMLDKIVVKVPELSKMEFV